jgi:uncharacterized protein YacL
MNTISNKVIIKSKIAALKLEREKNLQELNEAFQETTENLKPGNLIKRAISKATDGQNIADSISGVVIGLVSGYLVKRTLFSKSNNVIMNMAAMLVQSLVTNTAANNSDEIKSKGSEILHQIIETITSLFHKYKEHKAEKEEEELIEESINAQT